MQPTILVNDFNVIVGNHVWLSDARWNEANTRYFTDNMHFDQSALFSVPLFLNKHRQKSIVIKKYRWILKKNDEFYACAEAQIYFAIFQKIILFVNFNRDQTTTDLKKSAYVHLVSGLFAATNCEQIQVIGLTSELVKDFQSHGLELGVHSTIWASIKYSWVPEANIPPGFTSEVWTLDRWLWESSAMFRESEKEVTRLRSKRSLEIKNSKPSQRKAKSLGPLGLLTKLFRPWT